MTCQDCHRLQEENRCITEENTELRRKLALYENPQTPPSRRAYPSRRIVRGGKRFPGRPRGHPGRTRPRPRPDAMKAPERKERCEGCWTPLGEPSIVDHHVVEEIMNPHPRQVIDFLEFEWMCTECGVPHRLQAPGLPPGGRLGKNILVQATLIKF